MKHYTQEEWRDYKKGLINKKNIMEEHLRGCSQCRNLFLKLIDESELIKASMIIPNGFDTATMQYIKNQPVIRKSPGNVRSQRRKLLSYYAIAAAITLMLVNQGFFQLAVKEASQIPTTYTQEKTKLPNNFIFNWPRELTEKSSDLTNMIPKRVNFKEVIR
ncbi:MAG: hypothetical protein ABFC94_11200 [Syntrophomonas sp.]